MKLLVVGIEDIEEFRVYKNSEIIKRLWRVVSYLYVFLFNIYGIFVIL